MKTATRFDDVNPAHTTTVGKIDGAFHRVARVAPIVTVLLGCSVILGWAFDIAVLKTVIPGFVSMKANSALSFVLAGLSLASQLEPHPSQRNITIARGLAILAASIGFLTLLEYVFGGDFRIDQLLVAATPDPGFPFWPGRMAPNTALSFALLGTALLLLDAGSRRVQAVSQASAVVTLVVGFIAVVGYACNAAALIGVAGYTTMAVHTAGGLVVLSTGVLACRPHRGLMAILARDNMAGSSLRRLLPWIFAVPFTLGWLRLRGEYAGLYGTEFGLALMITALTVALVSAAFWNAHVQVSALETREQALRAQRTSEEHFRLAIEASPTGMIMVDREGHIVLINAQTEDIFGYKRDELLGQSIEMLVPKPLRSGHFELRQAFSRDPQARPMGARRDLFGLCKDGTEVPLEIALTPMETPGGGFVLTSIVDISERKRAEEEHRRLLAELQALTKDLERRVEARTKDLEAAHETLSRSETLFRTLFDDSPVSLLQLDFSDAVAYLHQLGAHEAGDLRVRLLSDPDVVATAAAKVKTLAVNQATLELYEAATETELLGSRPKILREEALKTYRDGLLAFLDGRTSFEGETMISTRKGNSRNINFRLNVLPGGETTWSKVVVSSFDMTARVEAEGKIRASLREKEVLLKEIHHRVKNNLQVISSLLNLQASHLSDPEARKIFGESRNRVHTIALVHEKLYGSSDLSQIQFEEYVQTLVSNLCQSLDAAERDISPIVEIRGIRLPVDLAIPCGLIINELVTNSLKHAFPNKRGGRIEVVLRRDGPDRLELMVRDDGIGLPSGLDPRKAPSFGLDLVYTLAEQLRAIVDVRRDPGTAFSFVFPRTVESSLATPQ